MCFERTGRHVHLSSASARCRSGSLGRALRSIYDLAALEPRRRRKLRWKGGDGNERDDCDAGRDPEPVVENARNGFTGRHLAFFSANASRVRAPRARHQMHRALVAPHAPNCFPRGRF
jgi:hypothetical protein